MAVDHHSEEVLGSVSRQGWPGAFQLHSPKTWMSGKLEMLNSLQG